MTKSPLKIAREALETCAINPDMPYFHENRYWFDERKVKEALAALSAQSDERPNQQSEKEALHAWIAERYGTSFDSFTYGVMEESWNARAALAQQPSAQQEPVAWMWQHEETGRIGFIDEWQKMHGWEANNPRLKIIKPLYTHPPINQSLTTQAQSDAKDAALLDYLDQQDCHLVCNINRFWFEYPDGGYQVNQHDTVRAAIAEMMQLDAAIAAKEGK